MIYLDYNATAPLSAHARDAMYDLDPLPYNASSVHGLGRKARSLIEDARRNILTYVCASDNKQLVFTSSGTEANNLALKGLPDRPVAVAATEHISVLDVVPGAYHIPVYHNGVVDLNVLQAWLVSHNRAFVSVMLANNETGVIQPIADIAKLVHEYDGVLHTDAVQGLKRLPVDIEALDVDMMTISSHKCGGPLGAAALIYPKKMELKAILKGGGQEHNIRPGTQNVPAIVGFSAALDSPYGSTAIMKLRDQLEEMIVAMNPDALCVGQATGRLANTSCIITPGINNQTQLIAYDVDDICVSAGSACSSGKVTVPHVLSAMGYDKTLAASAIRVSLGPETTIQDIEAFVGAYKRLYERTGA